MAKPELSPFAGWPHYGDDDAALIRRAARGMPAVNGDRLSSVCATLLGSALSGSVSEFRVVDADKVADEVADPCVMIVVERARTAGASVRVAVELSRSLAATVVDALLGGGEDAAAATVSAAAVSPLRDAERGVLLYAAARVLGAPGLFESASAPWQAVTVITTPAALAHLAQGARFLCGEGSVTFREATTPARVWVPEAALDDLNATPTGNPFPQDTPIPCVVTVARGTLPRRDLHGVRTGDVLVLDETWTTGADNAALLAGRGRLATRAPSPFAWWVGFTADGLRIDDRDDSQPKSANKGSKMETTNTATLTESPQNDVSIELTVDVAEFSLPLAELSKLRPGEVVATGQPLGRQVTLRAGGKAFAQGELVDVEGDIGVRITALHPR